MKNKETKKKERQMSNGVRIILHFLRISFKNHESIIMPL